MNDNSQLKNEPITKSFHKINEHQNDQKIKI
jgi:hypothetical protein